MLLELPTILGFLLQKVSKPLGILQEPFGIVVQLTPALFEQHLSLL
jgi:hypothetical protein